MNRELKISTMIKKIGVVLARYESVKFLFFSVFFWGYFRGIFFIFAEVESKKLEAMMRVMMMIMMMKRKKKSTPIP